MDVAFEKLKAKLKGRYMNPNMTPEEDVRLTFILGGTLHTLKELKFEKHYSSTILTNAVAHLILQIDSEK